MSSKLWFYMLKAFCEHERRSKDREGPGAWLAKWGYKLICFLTLSTIKFHWLYLCHGLYNYNFEHSTRKKKKVPQRLDMVMNNIIIIKVQSCYLHVCRIAGNFVGRKLLQISRFCGYLWKFYRGNLGEWCFFGCTSEQSAKFSPL